MPRVRRFFIHSFIHSFIHPFWAGLDYFNRSGPWALGFEFPMKHFFPLFNFINFFKDNRVIKANKVFITTTVCYCKSTVWAGKVWVSSRPAGLDWIKGEAILGWLSGSVQGPNKYVLLFLPSHKDLLHAALKDGICPILRPDSAGIFLFPIKPAFATRQGNKFEKYSYMKISVTTVQKLDKVNWKHLCTSKLAMASLG